MKYIGYKQANTLELIQFENLEKETPTATAYEVLVEIKATGINPVDTKVRASRNNPDGVILGWDAAGVVKTIGSSVKDFKIGDEVYYSGDIKKDGSYATHQLVDSRIVALKPKTISFADAAALPLTSLTAYEMLFEKFELLQKKNQKVLIIGGAGGVGSQAIQLLKTLTDATVIATVSRESSKEWVKSLGADIVVSHDNFHTELKHLGHESVDFIFSTTHTDQHAEKMLDIIRPFGEIGIIDEPQKFELLKFKSKAVSIHWELMFTKTLFQYNLKSQGEILHKVADLIDSKKIKTTSSVQFEGLTIDNVKKSHQLIESQRSIGKIVITI